MHPSWERLRLEIERSLGVNVPEETFKRLARSVAAELSLTSAEELNERSRAEEFGAALGLALFREKLS